MSSWSDRDISKTLPLNMAVEMMQNGTVVGRKRGISRKIEAKDPPKRPSNLPRDFARSTSSGQRRQRHRLERVLGLPRHHARSNHKEPTSYHGQGIPINSTTTLKAATVAVHSAPWLCRLLSSLEVLHSLPLAQYPSLPLHASPIP